MSLGGRVGEVDESLVCAERNVSIAERTLGEAKENAARTRDWLRAGRIELDRVGVVLWVEERKASGESEGQCLRWPNALQRAHLVHELLV